MVIVTVMSHGQSLVRVVVSHWLVKVSHWSRLVVVSVRGGWSLCGVQERGWVGVMVTKWSLSRLVSV